MQVIKYMFQPHGDDRGQLVSLEEFKDIPFEIKRCFVGELGQIGLLGLPRSMNND